ncbi:MAG: STAS domain-containing protein [Spirochaetes bacterium]|jgi:anti-sigma B factor antagonist|nr:STAS domain-containing protein [Spirochaetota bacterium]
MELNIAEVYDEIIVSFSGEIDMLSINNLKDSLFNLADYHKNIKINFENLDYLDSTGIGILLTLNRMVLDHDNTLQLVNVPDKIATILRLSSLNSILE